MRVHEVSMKNPFSLGSEMAIKKRVILLLLIVFVPFLLLEAHVFYNWFQKRKGMEMQANLELARAVGINFETFLRGLIRDELALGLALTGSHPISDKDRDRLLDALAADNPSIHGLSWINPAGVVIASSLRSDIGVDLSERSYFREVAQGRHWTVSELVIEEASGKPVFAVSRAIRAENGDLLGVAGAVIDPDRLSSVLGVHRLADAGVSLIDGKGMHVSRFPPIDYTWEQRNWLKHYPIVEESLKGTEIKATVTSRVTGKRRLAAFIPISSIGWVAASSRAEVDVTEAVFRVLMPQIGLTLLLTLIAAIAAVGLSRPITRSIFKMKEHAEELGRGETEHIVPKGPQELKALAHTLNEMAQKLRSREAAIRESESLYRAIAENFPDGAIYIFDHDLRFRVADGEAINTLGYRKEELEGKTIWEATDMETCRYLEQRYPRVLAGETLHFETQLKGRIFSSAYVPIRDEHGHIVAGMVVSHDITERKRAEEALRENEARYRELVQNANSAIIRWRADGTITFFNEYAQVFFGWRAEEVIGKHVGILVPEQESSGADLTGLVRDVVENPEKYVNNVNENLCRDGRRVWMTWTNRPIFDEQGRVTGILAVGSDITALRASEAKYRDLFENMTEEVHFWEVVRNDSGRIETWRLVDANPPALKTWGRNSVEEIKGKTTDEIFGPEATEHYLPVVNKIMNEGVAHAFEDYFPNIDKYFRFTSVPMGDHFITTGADITNIKKAENAILRQNELLKGINRIFETVVTSVSDEEFGTVCLSVAEEITGSAISFIGEIGPDDLLHDIAISNPGWQACAMYDPQGKRKPPGNFHIHGIYGSVLSQGKSILTNDPAVHPDSIGLPPGHPPLTSFLGVPLKQQDKTMGMVAVGNRKGGYGFQEQESLEILATVILQALARRRVEKAMVHLNETLEQKVQERTALAEAKTMQLRSLAVELIETEDREHRRFADLLHDDLQQMLASARFQLHALSGAVRPGPILDNVTHILEESIGKARSLSYELYPPVLHQGNLYSAIEWLINQMHGQFGLEVHLEKIEKATIPQLKNSPIKEFVFRTIKELLFNIVKHSGVKRAHILLSGNNGQLEITIRDEGKGFDEQDLENAKGKKGFGLLTIRERVHYIGGRFKIASAPGRGSSFTIEVPIQTKTEKSVQIPIQELPHVPAKEPSTGDSVLRVLFADDHKVMRQGLIRLISSQPGIVIAGEAADGKEAVELARQLRPDVILMDISMHRSHPAHQIRDARSAHRRIIDV
jgi:PAS domain S-box-containing protein